MTENRIMDKDEAGLHASRMEDIIREAQKVVVGQREMLEAMVMGLITGGHILVEGVPGLAKTLAVRSIARTVDAKFSRIQFTPDMMPTDVVGFHNVSMAGDIDWKQAFQEGPIFGNIVLADEINRATAKVQSALLEAMQERQVTVLGQTHAMMDPFLVLATQNPIEQEGTNPLPEAQTDRFMMKLRIDYPTRDEERLILDRMAGHSIPEISSVIDTKGIKNISKAVDAVFVDEKISSYILDIVFASRNPNEYGLDLAPFIDLGASPRASIALTQLARARALMQGRAFVIPEDVKDLALNVLRHRIQVSYEADAQELDSDRIITMLLDNIEVP